MGARAHDQGHHRGRDRDERDRLAIAASMRHLWATRERERVAWRAVVDAVRAAPREPREREGTEP